MTSWTGPTGSTPTACRPTTPGSPRCTPSCRGGLAPALVYTAGFDPLRDEGEAYADRLRAAGVDVELTRFDDQIHGFFNIVGVGRSRAANPEIARRCGRGSRAASS